MVQKTSHSMSHDLARLAGALARWTQATTSNIATAAGVDRGNLSRFLNRRDRSGIGAPKALAVLAALGWTALGPDPSRVHRWMLDSVDDMSWVFRTLLAGQAEVSTLSHEGLRPTQGEEEVLEHYGWLVARFRGSWILVGQQDEVTDANKWPHAHEDLLALLLDPRQGLAIQSARLWVSDVEVFRQLTSGELSPSGVSAALTGPGAPALRLRPSTLTELSSHLDVWLTLDELEDVLHDAQIRKARAEPLDLLVHLMDLDSSRGTPAAGPERRQFAARLVAQIASAPYKLRWPDESDN